MEGIVNNTTTSENESSSKNLLCFFKANCQIIIFLIFIILGLAFGGFFGSGVNYSYLAQTDIIFNSDFQSKSSDPIYFLFLESLCSQFIFTLSTFLMGFSVWGFALLFLVSFLKGFGIGVLAGFLIANFEIYGLLYYSVIVLPGAFIASIALIIQQKNAFDLSKRFFNIAIGKSQVNKLILNSFFKIHFKSWGISIILMLLSAALDAFSYSIITTLFNKIQGM